MSLLNGAARESHSSLRSTESEEGQRGGDPGARGEGGRQHGTRLSCREEMNEPRDE